MGRIISYDVQMEKDGFSVPACKIYGFFWWTIFERRKKHCTDDEVRASATYLMEKLNLKSDKTVRLALQELLDAELIGKNRYHNNDCNYYFIIDYRTYRPCTKNINSSFM